MARNARGYDFDSAARLSKRPGSVWNCLLWHTLKRSPGVNRKSRVSYPGPGYLSSATRPSLPHKHYNGLNQTDLSRLWQFCILTLDTNRTIHTGECGGVFTADDGHPVPFHGDSAGDAGHEADVRQHDDSHLTQRVGPAALPPPQRVGVLEREEHRQGAQHDARVLYHQRHPRRCQAKQNRLHQGAFTRQV